MENLDRLNKQDIIDLYEDLFFEHVKLVETHVIAEKHFEENSKLKADRIKNFKNVHVVSSPEWFKRRLPLYPDYNSML